MRSARRKPPSRVSAARQPVRTAVAQVSSAPAAKVAPATKVAPAAKPAEEIVLTTPASAVPAAPAKPELSAFEQASILRKRARKHLCKLR